MFEVFRDPVWQFIGAMLALAGIGVPIVLFIRQRQRKALGYEILAQTPLVSVDRDVSEEVVVLFAGEIVKNVHLIMLRIANPGNSPIKSADYERALRVTPGAGSRVLTAEVSETDPRDLQPDVLIEEDTMAVRLSPCLLNGGDSITIKLLVTEFGGEIDVTGRVVGVSKIQELKARRLGWQMVALFVVLGLQIALMLVAFYALSAQVVWLAAVATVGLLANGGIASYYGSRARSESSQPP